MVMGESVLLCVKRIQKVLFLQQVSATSAEFLQIWADVPAFAPNIVASIAYIPPVLRDLLE